MSGVRRPGSVAVVVPNWNGADRLADSVRSLARQTYPDLSIVVVDNGSTDDSVQVLDRLRREIGRPLVVLRNATNLGFAGGVNTGIRHALAAGFEFVALFNNDAVAESDWLEHLAAALAEHPDAGIATSRLLMADGKTVDSTGDFLSVWGIAFPRDRDQPAEPVRPSGYVFSASGGASLYRATLFDRIGLFDEAYFAYFEDVDLSFRAQLAGLRVFYRSDAVTYHDQGSTSGRIPGFAVEQMFKNLPMLLVKNLPLRLWPSVVPRFLLIYPLLLANAVRRGQWRPALRGFAAGVRLSLGHSIVERLRIQRGRTVDAGYLRELIWPDLPPGMVIARAARERARAAIKKLRTMIR
ncbi:MAG TPA: glycosyltransferase family 2 protein [Nakamurella sp.]|nr:glycosyltransferase family 2 protein [Nakamurella sp.]